MIQEGDEIIKYGCIWRDELDSIIHADHYKLQIKWKNPELEPTWVENRLFKERFPLMIDIMEKF